MKFIQRWSYGLANGLMLSMNESHAKRYTYYFGLQVWIGGAVKITVLLLTAALLNCLAPAIAIFISFAVLRTYAGGFHMDTYGRCIASSMILFMASAVFIQYEVCHLQTYPLLILAIISASVSFYCISKYCPVDHKNKPVEDADKPRLKHIALTTVAAEFFIAIILLFFRDKLFSLGIIFGIILEISSIIPAGQKFYSRFIGN
ncbi:MAG: accessory gene regulator B family protein [Bacillota bacterium]|nr:accessory gene regulator B family protein [Bacillota bacterium]